MSSSALQLNYMLVVPAKCKARLALKNVSAVFLGLYTWIYPLPLTIETQFFHQASCLKIKK